MGARKEQANAECTVNKVREFLPIPLNRRKEYVKTYYRNCFGLALSVMVSVSSFSVGAVVSEEGQTFCGETTKGVGSISVYEDGSKDIFVATEVDGTITTIVRDNANGAISIDGQVVGYVIRQEVRNQIPMAASEDNWKPSLSDPTEYTIPIADLGEFAIHALLLAYGIHDIPAGLIAQIIVVDGNRLGPPKNKASLGQDEKSGHY